MKNSGFRILQLVCIVLVALILVLMRYLGTDRRHSGITAMDVVILLLALYATVSSFTLQRWLKRPRVRAVQSTRRSTPHSRWGAGHLARLYLSTGVAVWAVLLKSTGGPAWMAYALCGMAIALLLLWGPGPTPAT